MAKVRSAFAAVRVLPERISPSLAWHGGPAEQPALDLAKPVPRNMILKQKTFTVIDGQLRLAN